MNDHVDDTTGTGQAAPGDAVTPEEPGTPDGPVLPDRIRERIDRLRHHLLENQQRLDALGAALFDDDHASVGADGSAPDGTDDGGEGTDTAPFDRLVGRSRRLLHVAERRTLARFDPAVTLGEQAVHLARDAGPAAADTVADPLEGLDGDWYGETLDRFPGLDASAVEHIVDGGGDSALGLLYQLRGYRGESLVVGLLGAGVLPEPEGTRVVTPADTTNQPGWDLVLDTPDGPLAANIKITDDPGVVLGHLADHPDVPVVYTTSDAAAGIPEGAARVIGPDDAWPDTDLPVVVDIGHTSDELTASTLAALGGDGGLDVVVTGRGDTLDVDVGVADGSGDLLDSAGDTLSDLAGFVVDHVPLVTLGFIAVDSLRAWARQPDQADLVAHQALRRARDATVSFGLGHLVGDLVAVPGVGLVSTVAIRQATTTLRRRGRAYETTARRARAFSTRVAAVAGV